MIQMGGLLLLDQSVHNFKASHYTTDASKSRWLYLLAAPVANHKLIPGNRGYVLRTGALP